MRSIVKHPFFLKIMLPLGILFPLMFFIFFYSVFYFGEAGKVAENYIAENHGGKNLVIRSSLSREWMFYFEGDLKIVTLSYKIKNEDLSEEKMDITLKKKNGGEWKVAKCAKEN